MKLLVIDPCNFVDFPTGGHLAFVRNMLNAYPAGELVLAGITTDETVPVGQWTKRTIAGKEYDYFAFLFRRKNAKRPLIPSRLTAYLALHKYMKNILAHPFDFIFLQPPEVLLAMPRKYLPQTCICMPGVENPLHCSRFPWARHCAWVYDLWYYGKLRHVKSILATASTEAIQEFVAIGKNRIKTEQVHQFPTRFDRNIYYVQDRENCRNQLGIPAAVPMFVTVGRLAEFKGWRLMLDAFHIFYKNNPAAVFYLIGDGEDEAKIQACIAEKGLQKSCFLAGRKKPTEISVYLNAATAFVMGSLLEGWSTTLVEACACGVPCVVTDFSSAGDMIENGKNGFVLDNRDPGQFAAAMQKTLAMDRRNVVEFDKKYDSLSVQLLREKLRPYLN